MVSDCFLLHLSSKVHQAYFSILNVCRHRLVSHARCSSFRGNSKLAELGLVRETRHKCAFLNTYAAICIQILEKNKNIK